MYVNLYDCIGDVRNKSRCISELCIRSKEMSNEEGTEAEVARKLNKLYKEDSSRYFLPSYVETTGDDLRAFFYWLNTGCVTEDGEVLYAQFSRSAFGWQGCYVGTESEIVRNQIGKSLSELREEKVLEELELGEDELDVKGKDNDDLVGETTKVTNNINDVFFSDLYSRLLIKTNWELENSCLKNYIFLLVNRINSMMEKGKDVSKYIIWNSDHSKALVNSALLDIFGNNILFTCDLHKSSKVMLSFTKLHLVDSKLVLCSCGFDRADLAREVECVPFYDKSVSELIFDADINDFDLGNWNRLSHCVVDRRYRFPDNWCNCSVETLCQDVTHAIELGIKLSKYDTSYVKPFYSIKNDKIQFIIPYHVGNNFQGNPELGIVVSKTDYGLWQVMTILDYGDALINIRGLSLYSNSSF